MRSNLVEFVGYPGYTSIVELKNHKEALKDEFWIRTMQDELAQYEGNEVQYLVPRLLEVNIIGTKWIVKNKINEEGNVTSNKARLVSQGYT